MEFQYKKIFETYEMGLFRSVTDVFGCSHCRCFIGRVPDCVTITDESAWIRPIHTSHIFPCDDGVFIRCQCNAIIGINEGGLYHISSIILSQLPFDDSRAYGLMPRFTQSPGCDIIICENEGCGRFFGLHSTLVKTIGVNLHIPSAVAHNIILLNDYTHMLSCICGNRIGRLIEENIVRLHKYVIVKENDPCLREIIVPQMYNLIHNDNEELDQVEFIDPDSDSDSEWEDVFDSGFESNSE